MKEMLFQTYAISETQSCHLAYKVVSEGSKVEGLATLQVIRSMGADVLVLFLIGLSPDPIWSES